MSKLRVGVIFGGKSAEKEVSLNSGRHVFNILDRSRFEPIAIFMDAKAQLWNIPLPLVLQNTTADIESRLGEAERLPYESLKERIDIAFLITFGKYGEDGCIQGLLELLGIPYTGSGVLGAALGADKVMQRVLLIQNEKINVPPYFVVREELGIKNYELWPERSRRPSDGVESGSPSINSGTIKFPIVVKPTREGSTIGVSVVKTSEEFAPALKTAFQYDTAAIIEQYLHGLEFSCVVLDGNPPQALPPTETVHSGDVFSYHDKYMPGGSQKITPARLPEEKLREVEQMCIEVFQTLGFRGYARIDGFVLQSEVGGSLPSGDPPKGEKLEIGEPMSNVQCQMLNVMYPAGTVLITDPNVFSGMAPSSWTFHQAAAVGITPTQLLSKIIDRATSYKLPATS